MAVAKVLGLETEYGLMVYGRGPDGQIGNLPGITDRVAAALIELAGSAGGAWTPNVTTKRYYFPNGSLLYRDLGEHPEYASPECTTAQDLVAHDRAGDEVLNEAVTVFFADERVRNRFPEVHDIGVYKHNVDFAGNTFGSHENYCVSSRHTNLEYARALAPFLATRVLYTGSGGILQPNREDLHWRYTLSPRAQHMRSLVDSRSTSERPLVLDRPEAHADPNRFRRLQLLCNDANRCEVATLLKMGTTAIVLAMIEDGYAPRGLDVDDPHLALRRVANDPTLTATLTVGGRVMTALDVQFRYLEAAQRYAAEVGLDACGGSGAKAVIDRWGRVLHALARGDLDSLFGQLDWVTKLRVFDHTAGRVRNAHTSDVEERVLVELQAEELAYSTVATRPNSSQKRASYETLRRLGRTELVGPATPSVTDPAPFGSRASLRGTLTTVFRESLLGVDWASVLLETHNQMFKLPLPEPLLDDAEELAGLSQFAGRNVLEALGATSPRRLTAIAEDATKIECLEVLLSITTELQHRYGNRAEYDDCIQQIGRSALRRPWRVAELEKDALVFAYVDLAVRAYARLGSGEDVIVEIRRLRDRALNASKDTGDDRADLDQTGPHSERRDDHWRALATNRIAVALRMERMATDQLNRIAMFPPPPGSETPPAGR